MLQGKAKETLQQHVAEDELQEKTEVVLTNSSIKSGTWLGSRLYHCDG